jgi:DUF4097 and DUF4098 domain-containing protein YvlB
MKRTAWMAVIAAAWLVPAAAAAQQAGNPNDRWCASEGDRDRGHYCEVREMTVPEAGGVLTVNARPNGGIKVVGWDRPEVRIRAKVVANADTNDEAKALAGQITVQTQGTIQAEGPARENDRGWSVSYEISAPSGHALSLASINGGISIQNVRAQVDFQTQNGGVVLTDVAGAFKGRTQNGGVQVSLQGQRWEGEGLDVQTQNGGIKVVLPEGYSARVETSTVNGSVRTDFPVTVTGTIDRRHLSGDLNSGGPTLRLVTTNGGVSITKK